MINSQTNEYLLKDIYYQILIRSNPITLRNMRLVNKYIGTMCKKLYDNKYFWIDKFTYDNLLVIPSETLFTIIDWIEEYKYCTHCKNLVENIFKLFNDMKSGLVINFTMTKTLFKNCLTLFEFDTTEHCSDINNLSIDYNLLTFIFYDDIDILISLFPDELIYKINRDKTNIGGYDVYFDHFILYLKIKDDKIYKITYDMYVSENTWCKRCGTDEIDIIFDCKSLLMSILYYFTIRDNLIYDMNYMI